MLALSTALLALTAALPLLRLLERRTNPEAPFARSGARVERLIPRRLHLPDALRDAPLRGAWLFTGDIPRRALVRVVFPDTCPTARRHSMLLLARRFATSVQTSVVAVEDLHPDGSEHAPSTRRDLLLYTTNPAVGWAGAPSDYVVAWRSADRRTLWIRAAIEGEPDAPGPGWFLPRKRR